MSTITNLFGLFLEFFKWILFPSSSNPALYVLGISVISTIIFGFLGKMMFIRRYPND